MPAASATSAIVALARPCGPEHLDRRVHDRGTPRRAVGGGPPVLLGVRDARDGTASSRDQRPTAPAAVRQDGPVRPDPPPPGPLVPRIDPHDARPSSSPPRRCSWSTGRRRHHRRQRTACRHDGGGGYYHFSVERRTSCRRLVEAIRERVRRAVPTPGRPARASTWRAWLGERHDAVARGRTDDAEAAALYLTASGRLLPAIEAVRRRQRREMVVGRSRGPCPGPGCAAPRRGPT
jgi:hypothetical protein